MLNLSVIACDLDGTLLTSSKQISPNTKETLIQAQMQGATVILASGRNITMVQPYAQQLQLEEFGGFIVGMNGQEIYDCASKETIYLDTMDEEQTKRIFRFAKKYKTQFLCEHETGFLVYTPSVMFPIKFLVWFFRRRHAKNQRHETDYSLVGGFMMRTDANVKVIHKENQILTGSRKIGIAQVARYIDFLWPRLSEVAEKDMIAMKVTPFWIDVMPVTVNKAAGIEIVLNQIGKTFENLISFGDAQNDVSMLEVAKVAVVMANGMDDVKELADIICDSNDQDGIAKTLENYL